MNHQTVTELLPWYVNGTLAPHERAQVEAELASCPLCAAELAELQRIHAAMHEIDQDAPGPSESLMGRTLARIDAREQTKLQGPSWPRWWTGMPFAARMATVAAALILVLLAAGRFFAPPTIESATAPQSIVIADHVAPQPAARQKTLDQMSQNAGRPLPMEAAAPAVAARSVSAGTIGTGPEPAAESKLQVTNSPRFAQLAPRQRPQLIRTGDIELLVPDVEQALAQLQSLAQLQFGDVISLDDATPSRPGIRHSAQVQIAVPADRFDQTMAALAKLGAVQSRTINAENVSDQIVDAQARLRNLRRTETDMLRILDRAGKIPDVLDVTQQIAQVREQIEQLDAQVQSLQHSVAYSTISIGIQDEKPVATAQPSMGAQLDDAWKAALRQVRDYTVHVAAIALTVIAFAPYWLAVLLIALLIASRLRRA